MKPKVTRPSLSGLAGGAIIALLLPPPASALSETAEIAAAETQPQSLGIDRPTALAVSPTTNTAYVTRPATDVVTVVDGESETITATISVPGSPATITVDPANRMACQPDGLHNRGRPHSECHRPGHQYRHEHDPHGVHLSLHRDQPHHEALYVGTDYGHILVLDATTLTMVDVLSPAQAEEEEHLRFAALVHTAHTHARGTDPAALAARIGSDIVV